MEPRRKSECGRLMRKRINELTKEQEDLLVVYRDKWINRALFETGPLVNLKKNVSYFYKLAGLPEPMVWEVESPYAMQVLANTLMFLPEATKQAVSRASEQVGGQIWDQIADQIGNRIWNQVEDRIADQVNGQVGDQVWGQVEGQAGEQVNNQIRSQIRNQVWRQVNDQVKDQVRNWVLDQVGNRVWDHVGDQVKGQVEGQVVKQAVVWYEVENKIWKQVLGLITDQVNEQVERQVKDRVWNQVGDQVRERINDQIADGVGGQVEDQVNGQVGDHVEDTIWEKIKTLLVDQIAEEAWDHTGIQVGDKIWNEVRARVVSQVQSQFQNAITDRVNAMMRDMKMQYVETCYIGLGSQAGWVSWADYMIEVLDLHIDEALREKWEIYKDFHLTAWDCITLQGHAIVCRRPSAVRRDSRNRLHSLDKPAIEWSDGFGLYFVSGVPMEARCIENPSCISIEDILQEQNNEVRKGLIQIKGVGNFLAEVQAQPLDEDTDMSGMPRRLFRFKSNSAGRSETWCVVEVECPSKHDKHYLWVPPNMKRCSQAVAWTMGFDTPELYQPIVEA